MTYPDTPGAQRHSETSREAAAKLDAGNLCGRVLRYLIDTPQGLTADDISLCMDIEQSTIGARLRELELKGTVIKTADKGTTRHKRKAFVYVAKEHWREHMGKATVKKAPPMDIVMLEADYARMKEQMGQAVKTIVLMNNMFSDAWETKDHYDLKDLIKKLLDDCREIIGAELLELVRVETIKQRDS